MGNLDSQGLPESGKVSQGAGMPPVRDDVSLTVVRGKRELDFSPVGTQHDTGRHTQQTQHEYQRGPVGFNKYRSIQDNDDTATLPFVTVLATQKTVDSGKLILA